MGSKRWAIASALGALLIVVAMPALALNCSLNGSVSRPVRQGNYHNRGTMCLAVACECTEKGMQWRS